MLGLQDIANQLLGYDPQAMSVPMAKHFLLELTKRMPRCGSEHLAVDQALDRILAHDVLSPIDVPGHDNSAMDGYAFFHPDTFTPQSNASTYTLHCVGQALAGQPWSGQLQANECVRITTGAVMPHGANTVVPIEFTQENTQIVTWPAHAARPYDNRRLAGEDIQKNAIALTQGMRLGPAQLGLLASLGIPTIEVQKKPTVAYFSTGNEILSLGQTPKPGAIYDSNRYTVVGMLRRLGCEVIDLGVVPDEPEQLQACFLDAASRADVILTSGGVSMGESDYTKTMMRRLGEVAFWRIAMRPGRPMAVGLMNQKLLFGLPGNPVAVMVTFLAFVRPVLLQLMGATNHEPFILRAKSLEVIPKKPGRTEFQRGQLQRDENQQLWVKTTGNQGSGILSSMVQADSLIVLHHNQPQVQMGDEVEVWLLQTCL